MRLVFRNLFGTEIAIGIFFRNGGGIDFAIHQTEGVTKRVIVNYRLSFVKSPYLASGKIKAIVQLDLTAVNKSHDFYSVGATAFLPFLPFSELFKICF